ncbi:DUF4982 domain-containing protein [Sphingobium sufflavum]|uniref:glycoside hydrolase family 2 protein n=1 Tax=Sphingobium sufflavum TaxID=1129547 RepID=UPI001F478843|nr:sugar-binding domain-containing protein [Sphingobium sufflavum]MCE7797068.1 DUF4982 domain-containing protein [Sphingobium sufflavum]
MNDFDFQMDRRQLLVTSAGAATLMMASGALAADAAPNMSNGRAQPLSQGWKFHRGSGAGFEVPSFDDSGWRALDLPHDWNIEDLPPSPDSIGPFNKNAPGGTMSGFAAGGEGWYRKSFRLANPRPGHVEIYFDGAYLHSDVWLNGHALGSHANGYTPFAFDLTPYLAADGHNVLAVRVRSEGFNARWYSGAGLYRHVWLDVLPDPARIARWGIGVITRKLSDGAAELEISTQVEGLASELALVRRILDAAGKTVWEGTEQAQATGHLFCSLPNPRLWSTDSPYLYSLVTELRRGTKLLDRLETPFGVRIISFDAQQGMRVNGVATKLRGGCVHHDHGILGAAAFEDAEDRKIGLLRARGFNAVRGSHNLFSPGFLRACDRQGMMVICEAFDVWHDKKFSDLDSSTIFESGWKTDLASVVLSARNHPSIVLWSIGNEIPARNSARGIELQWQLSNEVHRLDPTRPVTAAINGFAGHEVKPAAGSLRPGVEMVKDRAGTAFLDVVGYNYKLADYEADHRRFPDRVFLGSESFPKDVFKIWDLTERSPWLIGDFVWTAMDYLGEAGIGGSSLAAASDPNARADSPAWPWINAYCGDIDLIGQQRPASLARDVAWGVSPLEMAVQRPLDEGKVELLRFWGWSDELQSWSWPGAEGKPLTVRVYTAGDRVELRLKGQLIDQKTVHPEDGKTIEFKVAYAPGNLESVAYRQGREIGRRALETVGPALALRVREDLTGESGARRDLRFLSIEAVDAKGRLVPDWAQQVEVSVAGAGRLIALGSANPLAIGSYQSGKAQAWHGRALAVVRLDQQTGSASIRVGGKGVIAGTMRLNALKA